MVLKREKNICTIFFHKNTDVDLDTTTLPRVVQSTELSMSSLTTVDLEVPTTAHGNQLGGITPTVETLTTRDRLGMAEDCCGILCLQSDYL